MVASAAARYGANVVLDRIGSGPGSSDVKYHSRVASGNGQNTPICGIQVRGAQTALVQAFTDEQATTTPGP